MFSLGFVTRGTPASILPFYREPDKWLPKTRQMIESEGPAATDSFGFHQPIQVIRSELMR
jgi:hypothetical protein